jgi:hypothetical protein
MELCALAAEEQDPTKLMALVAEITALLEAKEQRLKGKVPSSVPLIAR